MLGCGGGEDATTSTTTTTTTTTTGGSTGTTTETSASCSVVPEETAGPYPADGSTASSRNYNVLALAGIVRSDIRTSIGSTAQALGVPLTVEITLTSTTLSCAALGGYAVYLWHCTADGNYSVYTTQRVNDNQLRGVVNERAVDSHVKNLRRKLAAAGPGHEWIRSVYGVGFAFDPVPEPG